MACASSCRTQDHLIPCKKCGRMVSCEGWYYRKSGQSAGERLAPCIDCSKARARSQHRESRDSPEYREVRAERMRRHRKQNPDSYRNRRLRDGYNITLECYEAMLAAQGGVCAICKSPEPGGKGMFPVDHNRKCCPEKGSCGACVRALLCTRCNVGIAMFNDNLEALRAAIEYIQRHS